MIPLLTTWKFLAGALAYAFGSKQVENFFNTIYDILFGRLFPSSNEDNKFAFNLIGAVGTGLIVALLINYLQKKKII